MNLSKIKKCRLTQAEKHLISVFNRLRIVKFEDIRHYQNRDTVYFIYGESTKKLLILSACGNVNTKFILALIHDKYELDINKVVLVNDFKPI